MEFGTVEYFENLSLEECSKIFEELIKNASKKCDGVERRYLYKEYCKRLKIGLVEDKCATK